MRTGYLSCCETVLTLSRLLCLVNGCAAPGCTSLVPRDVIGPRFAHDIFLNCYLHDHPLSASMPIVGYKESPPNQPLYFKSLKELDAWLPGGLGRHYDGILKYSPRSLKSAAVDAPAKGKLLASLLALRFLMTF